MTEVAEVSEGTQEVPVSLIDGDGNFVENWMEIAGVSEDLRGDPTLKATKSPASLASQTVNAQKMIGKSANMVMVPNEKSTQAEWDNFFSETGRPDTPGDYAITHIEGSGVIDAEVESAFKVLAHSEGLRPSTVQKLIALDDNRMMAMRQAMASAETQAKADAVQTSKTKWGDAYDERLHLANRMINENTDEGDHREAVLNAIGNDAEVADFLANIAKKFVEHRIISADISQPTPVEALAKAEELRNTPGYINGELHKTSPATHKRITDEITEIMKKAYPTK